MYIKLRNKKINVEECNTFSKRFRSYKLYLYPIEKALFFPKKKIMNTYWFCQRTDGVFVDKDFKILAIYPNVRSEKIFYCLNSAHLFILPQNTSKDLKIGDILKIYNQKED